MIIINYCIICYYFIELAFRFWNPWSVCCQQNFYNFYWALLNYLPCIAEVTPIPIDHPIFANCYPTDVQANSMKGSRNNTKGYFNLN